jgi:hypothetical protein
MWFNAYVTFIQDLNILPYEWWQNLAIWRWEFGSKILLHENPKRITDQINTKNQEILSHS